MSSSEPPSSKSLDEGWGLSEDEPAPDSDDETRTMQMSAAFLKSFPLIEEGMSSDDRETLPPPLPVSEYVRTMMQQVREEPEPISLAISSPFGRRGGAPSSWRSADLDRATPPSRRAAGWSVPQAPRATPAATADDLDNFRLIAFDPQHPGDDLAEEVDAPCGDPPTPLPPGSTDLPLEEMTPLSVRAFTGPQFPTLHPGLASLVPQHRTSTSPPHPPSSRGEPPFASFPPLVGAPWPSSPHARPPMDSDQIGEPPATQRGLAAPSVPPRAHPGTARFGSIGDASVQSTPPSTQRNPSLASQPPPAPADPFVDVRELYDAGDFRSALVMAEALLEADPEHVEARACAASCREMLSKKYLGRLGGLARIPRVAMVPEEIRWLSLDHKAGFLLSCIDGTSSIEEVLDVACMHEFEAIRILHDFRELGVIEILPDARAPRR